MEKQLKYFKENKSKLLTIEKELKDSKTENLQEQLESLSKLANDFSKSLQDAAEQNK